MKALTLTSTRLSTGVGIALGLALLLISGVATGAQGPLALRQSSGQASGSGGCVAGDSYDPVCDVNRDNIISIVDIMLVASKWRQEGTWTSDDWSLTGKFQHDPRYQLPGHHG